VSATAILTGRMENKTLGCDDDVVLERTQAR
jgi:hypothetical protein